MRTQTQAGAHKSFTVAQFLNEAHRKVLSEGSYSKQCTLLTKTLQSLLGRRLITVDKLWVLWYNRPTEIRLEIALF